MKVYPIYCGQDQIGTASVTRKGLFYQIRCRCDFKSGVPLRVYATGTEEIDLGLCVPTGGIFGADVSLPIKRLGDGELSFYAAASRRSDELIDVIADEPFAYISRLKDARLIRRGYKLGIGFAFTDRSANQQGSDQNP